MDISEICKTLIYDTPLSRWTYTLFIPFIRLTDTIDDLYVTRQNVFILKHRIKSFRYKISETSDMQITYRELNYNILDFSEFCFPLLYIIVSFKWLSIRFCLNFALRLREVWTSRNYKNCKRVSDFTFTRVNLWRVLFLWRNILSNRLRIIIK